VYNRTRNYNRFIVSGGSTAAVVTEVRTPIDPIFCPPRADIVSNLTSNFDSVGEYAYGVISDEVYPKRIKYKLRRKISNHVKPSKAVHHVYKKFEPLKGLSPFTFYTNLITGACRNETTSIVTSTPMDFLCSLYGPAYVKNNFLDSVPSTVSGESFTGVDWFSMMSEFNEAISNLIPNNFLSGETMLEGGIFVDALKLVLRPKKTVLGFIRNIRRRHSGRRRLGEIDRYYEKLFRKYRRGTSPDFRQDCLDFGIPITAIKEGVNADLLYKFGVKPAISDVRKALSAHSTVNRRMAFLNKNAGNYVPIRVRKSTSQTTYDYADFDPSLPYHVANHLREKKASFGLFAMGRVRKDINESSKYRLYAEYFGLNKIVGTAWELIPFTFVADWFTNAQERINDLTRIRLGEGAFYNLTSQGYSQKKELLYETVLFPGTIFGSNTSIVTPELPSPLLRMKVVDYTRGPGIPDTSGFFDIGNLGLFHGVTGTELILQKTL